MINNSANGKNNHFYSGENLKFAAIKIKILARDEMSKSMIRINCRNSSNLRKEFTF